MTNLQVTERVDRRIKLKTTHNITETSMVLIQDQHHVNVFKSHHPHFRLPWKLDAEAKHMTNTFSGVNF